MIALAAQPTTLCSILERLFDVVAIFGSVVLVVAVIMLLWAAILWITGSTNEEKIKQARLIILYSLAGLAVAILAVFADTIVAEVFDVQFLDQCAAEKFGDE